MSLFQFLQLKPLFKWSGGKSDELPIILKHLPQEQIETYIEPFVGGGSVFWSLAPSQAIIADVHPELISFYRALQKPSSITAIINFMETHPNEPETYYRVRSMLQDASETERASIFYYLRKTCYRGMMRYNKSGGFNIPFGRYKSINYSTLSDSAYLNLMKDTRVLLSDFEEIFAIYDDAKYFMFLDPPYDSKFTDYGYCRFDREKHETLARCFKSTKCRCLMIIGKTDFIVELYTGYIVEEFDKRYRFRLHSGRITGDNIDSIHLVVKNY